MTGSYSPELG